MSIKNLSEERKEEVWIKRRAEWWAGRRLGKSSEDVWTARKLVSFSFISICLIIEESKNIDHCCCFFFVVVFLFLFSRNVYADPSKATEP